MWLNCGRPIALQTTHMNGSPRAEMLARGDEAVGWPYVSQSAADTLSGSRQTVAHMSNTPGLILVIRARFHATVAELRRNENGSSLLIKSKDSN